MVAVALVYTCRKEFVQVLGRVKVWGIERVFYIQNGQCLCL